MMAPVTGGIVILAGGYLLVLAALSLFSPDRAARFLGGFASSAGTHILEQVLRILAGGALVLHAPRMLFTGLFVVFGWVLVVTSAALILIPWRWHHRFGKWAIPLATRHLKLYALAAFGLGVFIILSVILGPGSAG